jgi:hypothetical protein
MRGDEFRRCSVSALSDICVDTGIGKFEDCGFSVAPASLNDHTADDETTDRIKPESVLEEVARYDGEKGDKGSQTVHSVVIRL